MIAERVDREEVTHAIRDIALGGVGGLFGGCLGIFLFSLIAKEGFYAIALPGALVGLGCGCLSGRKSLFLGILCAVLGLLVGIVTEWRFAPFVKDDSFSFFLLHLHKLARVTQILISLGALLAFWFGRGREGGVWPRRKRRPLKNAD
ncbi:MAG: hypothetical protein ACYSWQ_14715 [Planctomycetota bacterium]|jgi:hypothetical protein